MDDSSLTVQDSLAEDVAPVEPSSLSWQKLVSILVMVAMVIAIGIKLFQNDQLSGLTDVPSNPLFWAAFVAYYFTLPFFDWVIFRKIWRIPASGIAILLRKRVSNEVLLNYSGELYFYLWAKERVAMTTAPFAVIKDVAITSALSNNLITMLMLIAVWPFVGDIDPAFQSTPAFLSAGLVVVISSAIILFRGMIFSLGRDALVYMMGVHVVRIVVSTFLLAALWHFALPHTPLIWWFALAAAKLLISRLPFVPNVELLFVTVAVFLIGQHHEIGVLMAMIAGLTFIAHIAVIVILPAIEYLFLKKE